MAESSYINGNMNCKRGALKSDLTKIKDVCFDFGISMVNISHTELNPKSKHKFKVELLLSDLDYALDAGALILSWFNKKFAHKEVDWYVRYNCGSARSIDRPTCLNYKQLVSPYL